MQKRSSKKRAKREDEAQAAVRIMETIAEKTEEREIIPPEVSAAAAALGRRGGLKGGPARAAKLTDERKTEIAKAAAAARWGKC